MSKKLFATLTATLALFASILVPVSASAVTASVSGITLDFTDSKKTNIVGTNGRNAGDIVLYNAVATINGLAIDAVVENVELLGMSSLGSFDVTNDGFDQRPGVAAAERLLQLSFPNVPSSGGFVKFKFSFFERNTYSGPGTGIPVTLQDVRLNAYDIDAAQYVEFSGFQQYKYAITNNPDRFSPAAVAGSNPLRTKFAWSNSASYDTTNQAGDNSYDAGRLELKFQQVTTLEAVIGDANGGGAVYGLEWGVGPAWPDGTTDAAFANNPTNTPPSSTDTSLYSPVNDAVSLSVTRFGNYSDPQGDDLAKVKIATLPTVGTLEKYNGTSWVAVVAGDYISKSDIDAGNLRHSRSASDTTDTSFTFHVNDGLSDSATANTMQLRAATNNQSLTFPQPSNKAVTDPAFDSLATSTSNLPVVLVSNTPSVCVIDSSFTPAKIVPAGAGTCSVTASEPGSSSFATAISITRTFTITGTNFVASFDKNDNAATGAVPQSRNGVLITMPGAGSMVKPNSTLVGWSLAQNGSSPISIGATATISANTTFYAIWSTTQAQTITFTAPANTTTATSSVTIAPTASSNLTVTVVSNSTGVCTVSGFTVTILTAGTCSLTASQSGDSTYSAAANVTRTFTISSALQSQTITFTAPANTTTATSSVTIAPTASSNLTVTVVSNSTSVCTVSGFTVTILTAGTCSLTASQAGDSTYSAAANVTRTFVITTAEAYVPFKPELKPGKGSGKIDQPVTVKPEVKAEGNNPSLCLVDLADLGCKQTVTVPGVGTFSIVNGSVTFSPVKGFVGEAKIVLRATDVYQQKIDQTITFLIAIEPDTKPVVAAETSAAATGATTNRKSLAVELPANEIPGATICIALVDASDCHPTSANDANIGTWLIAASGKVNFTPNPAFVGVANAEIRIIAANYKRIIPLAVTVTKRPPVTVTIGNFIDGSPVITKAIASKIRAFMKKYPDYANIECIGYTEGPTVLKTDRALSAARAKNACAYVTKSLTKKFVKVTRKAAQETVEASERRRITITLTD